MLLHAMAPQHKKHADADAPSCGCPQHRAAAKDHRPGKQQSNQSRFHFVLSPLADETANQRIEGTALSAPPLLYFFWRHSLSRAQKVC